MKTKIVSGDEISEHPTKSLLASDYFGSTGITSSLAKRFIESLKTEHRIFLTPAAETKLRDSIVKETTLALAEGQCEHQLEYICPGGTCTGESLWGCYKCGYRVVRD